MSGIRANGLELVASSRKIPEPEFVIDESSAVLRGSILRKLLYTCGHRGPKTFRVKIFGRESGKIRQTEFCPNCFIKAQKELFVFCARCGGTIAPGDAVALYDVSSSGLNLEKGCVLGDVAVGCLGWDCCPTGGFFAGHWTGSEVRSPW